MIRFGFLKPGKTDGREIQPYPDSGVATYAVFGAIVEQISLLHCVLQIPEDLPPATAQVLGQDTCRRFNGPPMPRPAGYKRQHEPGHWHQARIFDETLFDGFDKGIVVRWCQHLLSA